MWSTGTCYPASILKIICTIVVVCSLVGTFVMFYEEETSPCQVEEDDQTNILQGKLRLLGLFNFVAMMRSWQTEHAFGMAHLSELTHCLARIYIPSFEQCKQIRATLARRSLCRTGVAPARQETGVFPDRQTCDKKKGNKKKRKESISFRADCKFRGPKSQQFLNSNQKVFVLSSVPLVEASTSPKLGFALCLYLDKLSLRRATLRRFWLSKHTWKRHSRLNN